MSLLKFKLNSTGIAALFLALIPLEHIAVQFDYTRGARAFRDFEYGETAVRRPIADVFPVGFEKLCIVPVSHGQKALANERIRFSWLDRLHWELDDQGATYSAYWMLVLIKNNEIVDIVATESSFGEIGNSGGCYAAASTHLLRTSRQRLKIVQSD